MSALIHIACLESLYLFFLIYIHRNFLRGKNMEVRGPFFGDESFNFREFVSIFRASYH